MYKNIPTTNYIIFLNKNCDKMTPHSTFSKKKITTKFKVIELLQIGFVNRVGRV